MNRKTVVLVWKSNYSNYPKTSYDNFFGLGDLLRGAIGVFKLGKKYDFDVIVDKSLHPISKVLKCDEHKFSAYIKENHEHIPFYMPYDVENRIVENLVKKNGNILCFNTNMSLDTYDGEISHELISFINDILQPNEEFSKYIERFLSFKKQYNILHYRLGDDELVRCSSNDTIRLEKIYNHLLSVYTNEDIVISDSQTLKDYIKSRGGGLIRFLDTKVCHIGTEESYEAVRDTVFEFFLIMNSKKIKSFSIYDWVSGFVQVVHKIFGVPLEACINVSF